jgi:hypothetical protein
VSRGARDAAGPGRAGPAARQVSRVALLAALWSYAVAAQAMVTDFSDLWWDAAQSGWGMQLVRGGDATFATLYVYDRMERPVFYTATLSDAGGLLRGTLYETTGPYFGSVVFNPMKVIVRAVGEMTFAPATSETATLSYSVDGLNVTKNVTRQTLRLENLSGTYAMATQRATTHCADSAMNVDRMALETATFVQSGNAIAIDWTWGARACQLRGAYLQAGRLGAAQTSYACSDGEAGDMALFELQRRDGFVTGRFQGHAITNGCDYRGRVSAFVPE